MLVFDTNVLSELMRPAPDTAIASWVGERATSPLHLTAVSEAELRFGLAIMPPGRRRDGLAEGLERMLRTGFANRQIAAIAHSCGMAVVTRNVRDFADAGIDVIDPWTNT